MVLLLLGYCALRWGLPAAGHLATPGGPPSSGGAHACPDRVAAAVSGSATLVAAYETPKFLITLCRTADGQIHYDGQVKGKPASDEYHISLPAESTATGYLARNGVYTYEIRANHVIVSRRGEILLDSPLQPVSMPS